jgi:transposase-like protein
VIAKKGGYALMQELHFTSRDIRLRVAEGKRLFWQRLDGNCKDTVRVLLEEGLRCELKEQLKVGWYQRLPERADWRNGYTARSFRTRWGQLQEVKVPRSRKGTYQSSLVERYSRWAGEFEKQVQEAVLLGMSTRKTKRYFHSFFGSVLCSASAISAILKKLDRLVALFHKRPLADEFVYLFLDGFSLRIRQALRRPYTALVAWGMRPDGSTELLDYKIVSSEKAIFCQSFLEGLFQRGVTGKNLRLIITDGARGFAEAASWVYGQVPQQSCIVHRLRNVNKYLKRSSNRKTMLQEAKEVFNAPDKAQAVKRARALLVRWQAKEPKAVSCFARDLDSSLVFYDQPKELWKKLKSTNLLERLLRELRRRIRLVDSFANLPSADRWLYALTQKIINH